MIKAMQFSIMMWVLLICNVASAQTYSIRVQFNSNLRAEASLDSQVLESAPAGSVLQVLEHAGRWLKINRNGAELWMADWVSYSRVEDSAPVQPQPASNVPAQVDNCCFVDRQCQSAQDWENGYWAYQNGQCAASAPSQPQTSAQPVSNVPAQVDNCCFVDRQCNTPADWENGYHAFRDGQCGAPAQALPQSPAQPASSIPADVDNCCFVDRQCHSDADWTDGYLAYLNNQCPVSTVSQQGEAISSQAPSSSAIPLSTRYMTEGVRRLMANPTVDPFNNCCHMRYQDKDCSGDAEWEAGYLAFRNGHCIPPWPLGARPAIVGGGKFHQLVNRALDLIATHAPDWLHYINLSGAREFKETPNVGGFINSQWSIWHGWLDYLNENPSWEPDLNYIAGYAGGITHEACHAIQQRTYSQSPGWTNEAACVEAQLAVIEAINPNSPDVPWLRDLVANIQNPEVWWWD
ncbi:MAG: SH3 domain-containing protein [Chloroflexota bacterium]|nr:SH3 domain-containing protein [Chloroflexota bacterium]